MYDLETFRKKCDYLLQNAINVGDQESVKKLQKIKHLLVNDNCLVDARKISIIYVLKNLGYNSEQINDIYNYFNRVEMFDGMLEYVDDNGQLIQVKTLVNPEVEKYYKFVNGPVFKYSAKDDEFYLLFDGQWVYDGEIKRKFYDVGYDYSSVKCVVKNDSLRLR